MQAVWSHYARPDRLGFGSDLSLAVGIEYSGNSYRINMNYQDFAETDAVTITCKGVVDPTQPSTSACNQWKIEPNGLHVNGEKKNVGKLLKLAARRNQTDQDLGDFYMSFDIDVTNP